MNKDESIKYVESIHREISQVREEVKPNIEFLEEKNVKENNMKDYIDKLFEDDSNSKILSIHNRQAGNGIMSKHETKRKDIKEEDNGITERINVKDDSNFNLFYQENLNKDNKKDSYKLISGSENNKNFVETNAIRPLNNGNNKEEKELDFFVFDENKNNNSKKENNELVSAEILDNLINNLKDPINEEFNYEQKVMGKHGSNQISFNINKQANYSSINIENKHIDKRDRIYEGNKEILAESSYGKISIGRDKDNDIKNRKYSVLQDNLFTKIRDSSLDIERNKKMAPYMIINPRELDREIDNIFLETLTSTIINY